MLSRTAQVLLCSLALALAGSAQTTKAGSADDTKGAVCSGFYGPFQIQTNEMKRVYFTVGDSPKLFFDKPETVVLDGLDLHKTYKVRVFYDDKPIESWKLRFDALKVHMVTVWRSPGYWHMDPNPSGHCGERR